MKKKIILYSRNGCHLCEEAKEILQDIQKDLHFQIEEIDIDKNDSLTEEYGLMIPVVQFEGEILQYGKIVKNPLKSQILAKNIG